MNDAVTEGKHSEVMLFIQKKQEKLEKNKGQPYLDGSCSRIHSI
jgi:hypothetical protein